MNSDVWQNGIRPMLWALLAMAVYAGWLVYFYRRQEPRFSAWLDRCLKVCLELTRLGYEATGGEGWLHGTGAALVANVLLILLILMPFFVLVVAWWAVFH
jgi:hypothetical protein